MINGGKLVNSPVRSIHSRVERYKGSILVDTFTSGDKIKEVTLERVGDSTKFFGFGVCQKGCIKLIDKDRELDVTTENHFRMAFDGVTQSLEQVINGNRYSYANGYSHTTTYSVKNVGLTPGVKYTVTIDADAYASNITSYRLLISGVNVLTIPITGRGRQILTSEFIMPEYPEGKTPAEGYGAITVAHGKYGESTIYNFSVTKDDNAYVTISPNMYVTEVRRDENTNQLSITVYDRLYNAAQHNFAELGLGTSYAVTRVVSGIASLLGIEEVIYPEDTTLFDLTYARGANYEGTEKLRDILDDIAELTTTIYFINRNNQLVFKRIATADESVLTISKQDYVKLESSTNRRLSKVCSTNELGDSISHDTGHSGTTQYIRDNGFLELREDIDTIVQAAIDIVGDLTINQFTCSWRGNPLLEIGDKIELVTKDDEVVSAYVFDDIISYKGTFSQSTKWKYTGSDTENDSNPATLGDALKRTYARVDKISKDIELVASDITSQQEQISSINVNINNISASVQKVETSVNSKLNNMDSSLSTLTSQVEAKMSPEDVTIQIQKEMANGTNKVLTSTGFTFNENGLKVSKSGSTISTQITEDGMSVSRNWQEVLRADNEGVKAEDLHATTYLIIGQNSRLEDYSYGQRTGCFWIGG